jgi:hypothetical protein
VPGPRVLVSNCGERGSTTGVVTGYDQAFIAGACGQETNGSQPVASGAKHVRRDELTRTWIYAGRRHCLTPGRYRWYVWAGYGRQAQNKFGPLLGSNSFVVAAR